MINIIIISVMSYITLQNLQTRNLHINSHVDGFYNANTIDHNNYL